VSRENQLPIKQFADGFKPFTFAETRHSIQICASLNHRRIMKAEANRLIPRKLTENLELSMIDSKVK